MSTQYTILDTVAPKKFVMKLITKKYTVEMTFQPAQVGQGWDWSVFGGSGREVTREKAIESARQFALNHCSH